jgi:hypothetical protein
LALFAIVFAVLVVLWRRLASMHEFGLLAGNVGAVLGMMLAFIIALSPLFLRLLIFGNETVREIAAAFFTAGFVAIEIMLAVLVHRSHAYRSKARWRVIHHALWLMGGIFLISLFVPLATTFFLDIPARFLVWTLGLVLVPMYQRVATRVVANPAKPPAQAANPTAASVPASSSNSSSYAAEQEQTHYNHHGRSQRRGRGGRYRRPQGSRRRM